MNVLGMPHALGSKVDILELRTLHQGLLGGNAMNLKNVALALMALAYLALGVPAHAQEIAPTPIAQTDNEQSYRLGAGDKIRVSVFDEPDLSGEFVIDGTGYVRLPLIGQMRAGGLTVIDFEAQVVAKLNGGYLKNAKLSVEVINYRPFYIIGEVNKPGEYAYVNGMNILNAVALAGGYTFRANESDVFIRRNGSTKEEELPADQTTQVNPGDIIRIAERFF
jgi:polysaccharide export outer membrane protein